MSYRKTHFALELMKTGIFFLENAKMRLSTCDIDPFRSLCCYSIRQVYPGLWLPLNRDYNVLGLIKAEWSDYTNDLYQHMLIKSEDINFNVLWDNDTEREISYNFFVYSDFTSLNNYYGRSSKESNKILLRYKKIIETAFLGKKNISFEEAWNYKKNYKYEKYYKKNLERIVSNSN